MLKRSKYLIAIAALVGLVITMAYAWLANQTPEALNQARVEFLITELTTTPSRQQVALDELVKGGNDAIIFLFPYLHDNRKLATTNVKFMNTQSPAVEKYFLTLATTVDELTLRYLCWTTMVCQPDFDEKNHESRKLQVEKLASDCVSRFPQAEQCRVILSGTESRPK